MVNSFHDLFLGIVFFSFFFDLLHAFLPSVNVILYGKFYLFVIFDMCIGRGLQRRSKSLVFKRISIKNQYIFGPGRLPTQPRRSKSLVFKRILI